MVHLMSSAETADYLNMVVRDATIEEIESTINFIIEYEMAEVFAFVKSGTDSDEEKIKQFKTILLESIPKMSKVYEFEAIGKSILAFVSINIFGPETNCGHNHLFFQSRVYDVSDVSEITPENTVIYCLL